MSRWLLVMLLLVSASTAQATNYYVDKNNVGGGSGCSNTAGQPGTQAQPWCSIAYGLSRVPSGPGNTLFVRAGTYDEHIDSNVHVIPSGNSTAPFTLGAFTGETVILRGINLTTTGVTPATSYVVFDHLILDGNNGAGGMDLFGQPVHHITFQYGEIRNVKQLGPSCSMGPPERCPGKSGSAAFFGTHHITLRSSRIHHNGLNEFDHGIYWSIPDAVIEYNEFDHNSGYGIHVYDSACRSYGFEACAERNIVRGNDVHDNGVNPYAQQYQITMNHGHNSQFYNNILRNGYGMNVSYGSPQNYLFANNTFRDLTTAALSLGSPPSSSNSQVTNPRLINNIFASVAENVREEYVSGVVYQKNLCSASGTGCTQTGNPALNSDSTLQGSSDARNQGTPVSEFSSDKALRARPQGSQWDIGAYEYPEGGGLPPSGNPIYVSAGGHGDTPTDSGDCTVPENILTPRATLAAALACLQIPGKHLRIRGGTYSGVIDTSGGVIVGGIAADNPTTVEAYTPAGGPAEAVTIQMTSGQPAGLFLNGVDFVTVDGLLVDAMTCADCNAMACLNSGNVTIRNSTFRKSYYEAGYFSGCPNLLVSKSKFHDGGAGGFPVVTFDGAMTSATFDEVEVSNGPAQGIAANVGSGSNSSLSILRTQIHHTGTSGSEAALDLASSTGATIVNSIIDHNKAGVRLRGSVSGAKVYHNAVASNTPGVAIQCDAGASGVSISNNISYGNGTDSVVNNCGAMIAATLTTNPLWVDVAARDFHLQTTPVASPALDVLSPPPLPEATIAIDGTTRPQGGGIDLGPWEQAGPGAPTTPTTAVQIITRYLGMFY